MQWRGKLSASHLFLHEQPALPSSELRTASTLLWSSPPSDSLLLSMLEKNSQCTEVLYESPMIYILHRTLVADSTQSQARHW